MKPPITVIDLDKAKAFANKMCVLRQNVIDKAKAWHNNLVTKPNQYYSYSMDLDDAVEKLEKFEREYAKKRT